MLDTLIWLKNETDVWVEITTLLIPDENDSEEEIKKECDWILENLGENVPLHFTAFHPDFKMRDKNKTNEETLIRSIKIAINTGINFCYVGNIYNREGQTTYCPNCKTKLIERDWHSVLTNNLNDNICHKCYIEIPGVSN